MLCSLNSLVMVALVGWSLAVDACCSQYAEGVRAGSLCGRSSWSE